MKIFIEILSIALIHKLQTLQNNDVSRIAGLTNIKVEVVFPAGHHQRKTTNAYFAKIILFTEIIFNIVYFCS